MLTRRDRRIIGPPRIISTTKPSSSTENDWKRTKASPASCGGKDSPGDQVRKLSRSVTVPAVGDAGSGCGWLFLSVLGELPGAALRTMAQGLLDF
jgi:hypothetical protein